MKTTIFILMISILMQFNCAQNSPQKDEWADFEKHI